MKYSPIIQQHFFNPYHLGEWQKDHENVRTATSGSYALGAVVQLQCLLDNDEIKESRFKAYGNPYLIAAASFTTNWLERKKLSEVALFNYKLIIEALELPQNQQHCAIIVESAVEILLRGEKHE